MAVIAGKSIQAADRWTRLCDVKQGQKYDFLASGTWIDWWIETDADGYEKPWLAPFRAARRAPREPWFALVGTIDKDLSTAFGIGSKLSWTAPKTGTLWCFANDVAWMYWNNKGAIDLQCTTPD
jgi:hypothetical protein